MKPFTGLRAAHAPHAACQLDAYFSEYTSGEWRLLGLEADEGNERLNHYDPVLDFEPSKGRRPAQGTPASNANFEGRVELDDPLKRIPAAVYLPALTGTEVSSNGRCRCPMPDHEDVHPSANAYDTTKWRCFGCGARGSIIDLGAALYDLEPTGRGYKEIRRRLLADLGVGRPI